ncbi:hypothetical protein [Streptomyces sp. NBRC 110028]|uniref:hypothetical protein n=1 Tax=Streptomyces sp. NBRC 110028 TaxID=1621260 RepID=UPI000A3F3217|nr:hypothetical protein [Streptomyces sp. NBRC 110028]
MTDWQAFGIPSGVEETPAGELSGRGFTERPGHSVAILDPAPDGLGLRPVLHRQRFDSTVVSHRIAGLDDLGYSHVKGATAVPASVSKCVARARNRLNAVGQLLGGNSVQSGDSAFYHYTLKSAQPNIQPFVEANFPRRDHHLHLKGTANLPQGMTEVDQVNLVTGLCLFSAAAAVVELDHGRQQIVRLDGANHCNQKVRDIVVNDELSLYEHEAITRLTGAVSDLASAMHDSVPVSITIDIPRVQYYFYPLDWMRRGLITPRLVLKWFDHVDERHERIADLSRARILVDGAISSPTVRHSSGLGELAGFLRSAVASGRVPELTELVSLIASGNDPLWTLVLGVTHPRDLLELAGLSYLVEELRAGHSSSAMAGFHHLGIMVENYSERVLFERANKVAKQIQQQHPELSFPIVGLYPLQRFFIKNTISPLGTYQHAPDRIVADARQKSIDLFDVVNELYAPQRNHQELILGDPSFT